MFCFKVIFTDKFLFKKTYMLVVTMFAANGLPFAADGECVVSEWAPWMRTVGNGGWA